MEKQSDDKNGLFDNDDLDDAIANADDTGMVKSEQQLFEVEELKHLPEEEDESP